MDKKYILKVYDNFYRLNKQTWKRNRKRNHSILKWILNNVPFKASILDVGCGPGHLLRALETANYKVYGTEISQWLLDNLLKDLQVEYAFINDMNIFENNAFDCVVCSDVLEHLMNEEEAKQGFKELIRITRKHVIVTISNNKSKGKKLGSTPFPNNDTHLLKCSHSWWTELFGQHFQIIKRKEVGSGLYVYGIKTNSN